MKFQKLLNIILRNLLNQFHGGVLYFTRILSSLVSHLLDFLTFQTEFDIVSFFDFLCCSVFNFLLGQLVCAIVVLSTCIIEVFCCVLSYNQSYVVYYFSLEANIVTFLCTCCGCISYRFYFKFF